MTKYNLPLTYAPKIPKVLSGECTQTIRAGSKFKRHDIVSFHGWEGRPYRSKWSFKTRYFTLVAVEDIKIFKNGLELSWQENLLPWASRIVDNIALLDGIDPPTGVELGKVLLNMHKTPNEGLAAQIITWT